MRSISLIPFNDPDNQSQQRWLDIDDRPYAPDFRNVFRYKAGQVILSYDPNPEKPFFIGHIEAQGLKPNFAYQLKLAGKPVNGGRGWGEKGDDRANEAIGRVTRWWNDSTQANSNDTQFNANQKLDPENQASIYGYDFMGEFVTDQNGNASVDFNGSKAYHIVWQDKQKSNQHRVFGNFKISSNTPPYYGYAQKMAQKTVKLWYEWEPRRVHDVKLPPGTYNCRFLLTEETFHALDIENGGKWPTVLASEDFTPAGEPDDNTQNDIVFTIR
ncbi:hypothetical protein EON80_03125 [bacterium]|nr:MAG: hypothetical protein EON80_03125 [bacterium]